MSKIYVTRHGQTLFNLMGRTQGWSDSPLTKDGIEIAKMCGRGLADIEFGICYSSDLLRTKETLKLIINENKKSLPPTFEKVGLRERCFGDFEGSLEEERAEICSKLLFGESNKELYMQKIKSREISMRDEIELTLPFDKNGFAETYEEVETRALKAMIEIVHDAHEQDTENVLVVTHGMTMMILLSYLLGDEADKIKGIANASVAILNYDGMKLHVEETPTLRFVEAGKSQNNKI